MRAGIIGDSLMARVGPTEQAAALKQPYVREIDPAGIEFVTDLNKRLWFLHPLQ